MPDFFKGFVRGMPRIGMEAVRRQALLKAVIDEIGEAGSLEVTVSRIARRAGVSSALAHHYFGSKDQLLLAAMRAVLQDFGREARAALALLRDPRARLDAIIEVCFSPTSFRPEMVAAWLNFYVHAQRSAEMRRLLQLYHRRLHTNLVHALRPLVGTRAPRIASTAGSLIDGVYLRAALGTQRLGPEAAIACVADYLALELPQRSAS